MIEVKLLLFINTSLCFYMQVDAAILEVGLGGKFDATNAVSFTSFLAENAIFPNKMYPF